MRRRPARRDGASVGVGTIRPWRPVSRSYARLRGSCRTRPGCTCTGTRTASCCTSARRSRCASGSPRTPVPSARTWSGGRRTWCCASRPSRPWWRARSSRRCCWSRTSSRRTGRTFNVRLRDDKSYPYIAVTLRDRFPRVMFTRERHRRGVRYFGPYPSASKVRETLDTLNRVFPFRPCEGPEPGRRSGVPCLDYHIGRCGAPCVGLVTEVQYGLLIDQVVEFLEGRTAPVRRAAGAGDARRRGRPALRGRGAGAQPARGRGDAARSGSSSTGRASATWTCSAWRGRATWRWCSSSRCAAGGSASGSRSRWRTRPARRSTTWSRRSSPSATTAPGRRCRR